MNKLDCNIDELDHCLEDFYIAIANCLSQMDNDAAIEFVKIFENKINEQKCAQENSGTSR